LQRASAIGRSASALLLGALAAARSGLAVAAALAVALLALGGGEASAQAPPPVGVPTLGIAVNTILENVQTALTGVMSPFILFSIGVMVVLLIWRVGRRFAGGGT
jgi:hypothetical protein